MTEIDRDILRLLLKRHNLIERMRGSRPRLDASEEKYLREAWQKAVARVSRDADLSGRFFALMQDATFLPRPASPDAGAEGADVTPAGPERRDAFNLAPPRKPVELSLAAPLDCRETRAWLFLAAASGRPVRLVPCLMNDPLVDLLKALNQLGAAATRERDAVVTRAAEPLARPDKVVYVGDDLWNLFLLLAFYVAKPSRVKFLGETGLKLADLSSTRRFLPLLGARFINVIPRSSGLPARLECSGIVPGLVELPRDVPGELGAALLLAASFFEREFTLALGDHPQREDVLALALPVLRGAGIAVTEQGGRVSVQPGAPKIPAEPRLPMDAGLASYLLALTMPLGGTVRLAGAWSEAPEALAARETLLSMGLPLKDSGGEGGSISVTLDAPREAARLSTVPTEALARLSAGLAPLPLALAACAALSGVEADAPAEALEALRCPPALAADFFAAAGLELEDGSLRPSPELERDGGKGFNAPAWNAPSPSWALALALAACARPERCHGFRLGNPGVLTSLYPGFWALYNGLPRPAARQRDEAEAEAPRREHRRIRTATMAVLPPEPEADEW
ncbi:3-phosphoshikimate 1-carboxyvinyltransferase [Desulfovibrio sp.]|uniref:3-phosphoshikimate 1-carboxyvinyltransferase n=1 Tax=Desulfovibrio sp. TaxID=885 RepID=UPI00262C10AB|nr:3-phosphoshikimate 1-carboxyvinyltransferase [Desulfovibrio sp.]